MASNPFESSEQFDNDYTIEQQLHDRHGHLQQQINENEAPYFLGDGSWVYEQDDITESFQPSTHPTYAQPSAHTTYTQPYSHVEPDGPPCIDPRLLSLDCASRSPSPQTSLQVEASPTNNLFADLNTHMDGLEDNAAQASSDAPYYFSTPLLPSTGLDFHDTPMHGDGSSNTPVTTEDTNFPQSDVWYPAATWGYALSYNSAPPARVPAPMPTSQTKGASQTTNSPSATKPTRKKPYSTKQRVQNARRTYQARKVLQCSECEHKATCQSNLEQHMAKHTGERPYDCEHRRWEGDQPCGKSFPRAWSLHRHYSDVHKVDIVVPKKQQSRKQARQRPGKKNELKQKKAEKVKSDSRVGHGTQQQFELPEFGAASGSGAAALMIASPPTPWSTELDRINQDFNMRVNVPVYPSLNISTHTPHAESFICTTCHSRRAHHVFSTAEDLQAHGHTQHGARLSSMCSCRICCGAYSQSEGMDIDTPTQHSQLSSPRLLNLAMRTRQLADSNTTISLNTAGGHNPTSLLNIHDTPSQQGQQYDSNTPRTSNPNTFDPSAFDGDMFSMSLQQQNTSNDHALGNQPHISDTFTFDHRNTAFNTPAQQYAYNPSAFDTPAQQPGSYDEDVASRADFLEFHKRKHEDKIKGEE